jgi:GNAT superfamily N-acetyltransferase
MVQLKRTTFDDADFQELITQLDIELRKRYYMIQEDYEHHNKVDNIKTVVVAYDNDLPVGCGCFKEFGKKTVEIKRMYIIPAYRGKSISRLILQELEQWALASGYTRAVLETGDRQNEAVNLYKSCGYEQIENYREYIDMAHSWCFGKDLQKKAASK